MCKLINLLIVHKDACLEEEIRIMKSKFDPAVDNWHLECMTHKEDRLCNEPTKNSHKPNGIDDQKAFESKNKTLNNAPQSK